MQKEFNSGLMWFRRDLRADDNAALYHALKRCQKLYCVFIFDRAILDGLPRQDRRVEFIHHAVIELDQTLRTLSPQAQSGLIVQHANAQEAIIALADQLHINAVFANHDDEPSALARDAQVKQVLTQKDIAFITFKDHCIFERQEILTQAGKPYSVFTPYKNAWLKQINSFQLSGYPTQKYASALAPLPPALQTLATPRIPTLATLGFTATNLSTLKIPLGALGGQALFEAFCGRMDNYHATRDFPAIKGPSYLGVHLRFGTLSIRQLAATAYARHLQGSAGASVWLNELIWRDFYCQILANYPHVTQHSFKPEYDAIEWEQGEQAEQYFQAWCNGATGYPLIDAAMAQINQTGYMHNRLRMVVASFLVKDLGINWQRGEAYFARHLNDFDLSANNGGWQWASSSGCDAQPYFRIFNPISQSQKFDAQGIFIKKYLPQLSPLSPALIHAPWQASPVELAAAGLQLGRDYPQPIIDHASARAATLLRYACVKKPVPLS